MSCSLQRVGSETNNQITFSLISKENKGNSQLENRVASLKLTGQISQSLGERFLGFFGKRTTVQINLTNAPKPIYVKIDYLVKKLNISKDELKKVANDSGKATKLVIDKLEARRTQTREKLEKLNASEADRKIEAEAAFFTNQFPGINTKISDAKFIHLCLGRMGHDSMTQLMRGQSTPKKQQVMINTMISIGKTIGESQKVLQDGQKVDPDNLYVKRLKPQPPQNETYAFAITNEHVYVCLSKEDGLLGEGSYKIATTAFKVANKGNNEIAQIEKVVRLKAHSKVANEIEITNEDMKNENELSIKFSENGLATQPYIAKLLSKNSPNHAKTIAFQKSYEQSDWIFDDYTRPVSSKVIPLIDIGRGLAKMHARGWVHCDVKKENVLIDDNGNAILADFGMTKENGEGLVGGTTAYLPPEFLQLHQGNHLPNFGLNVRPKLDSFSYGMVLLEAIEIDESEKDLYQIRDKGLGVYCAELKDFNSYNDREISQVINDAFFPRLIDYIQKHNEEKREQIIQNKALSKEEKNELLEELAKKKDFEETLATTAWILISLKPDDRSSCQGAVEFLEEQFKIHGFKVS